jgi:hypothetical protein
MLTIGLALCAAACTPATTGGSVESASAGAAVEHQVLRPGDFQSFVKNWDGDRPLCARIASEADWDRYFGAAAGNGPPNKPFNPPAGLWRTHNGYLLARSANAGPDINALLTVQSVQRAGGATRIDTAFNQGSGSYQVTTYVLVTIPKTMAGRVAFTDRGQPVCAVPA